MVDQSDVIPQQVQQIIDAHPNTITYHPVDFKGLPLARNYGWKNAKYDAIVYVDDDIRCEPNLVSEHFRTLKMKNIGIVAGHIHEVHKEETITEKVGEFSYWTARTSRGFSNQGEREVNHAPGGNFSIWRKVAKEIGGFDERLNVGAALYEETEFCLRAKKAGYVVYFNDKASLNHLASPTGGCRVDQVQSYVWALAHNRTIMIRRNLKWYQQLIAFSELFRLGLAYAVHYRQPSAIRQTLSGSIAGFKDN